MKKLILLIVSVLFLPSLAFASVFTHNLSYGVVTTDVASLQQFLNDEGLYYGPINSTFGPLTQKAIIAFQKQEGISPATGYFGPATRARAEVIASAHPEWLTTISNSNTYKNVDGNTIHSPVIAPSIPAGATAECRDGTYSFSQNHRGSCSHHGGVANWLQ